MWLLMITYNPYWWATMPRQQVVSNRIGIYKLSTNNVTLTDDSVDFTVSSRGYRLLPPESLVLIIINNAVPDGGDSLPVNFIVPALDSTAKIALIDTLGDAVTGSSVKESTERLLYINKAKGIIRLLDTVNS